MFALLCTCHNSLKTTRDKLGERRNCAGGGKKRKGGGGILGVSQSVSFAYISLVSWNAILSPRQQVESSRQTQASLLGDTVRRSRPALDHFTRQRDGQVFLLFASAEGSSERGDIQLLSPSTFTLKDSLIGNFLCTYSEAGTQDIWSPLTVKAGLCHCCTSQYCLWIQRDFKRRASVDVILLIVLGFFSFNSSKDRWQPDSPGFCHDQSVLFQSTQPERFSSRGRRIKVFLSWGNFSDDYIT